MSKDNGQGNGKNNGKHNPAKSRNGSQPYGAPQGRRPQTPREVALHSLLKVEQEGAYSNLQLNRALQDAGLARADAGLATELVYGTIQRQKTLDYWLGKFVAKGIDKLQPWVLILLRMSLYQLVYLDRVPEHAAVNEAVQIAKRRGHQGISGMVNGVLRSAVRRRGELDIPEGMELVPRIALRHSYPEWLVKRWVETYGETVTVAMCASSNEPPPASIRVNRLRMDRGQALGVLKESGYEAAPAAAAESGIIVERGGNLSDTPEFRSGSWTIQDESSMLVAQTAAPAPGMKVIDCCAAPGGKTTHLAELMNDEGLVVANDIHPHKEKLIADQAERLGLTCIRTTVGDAGALTERHGKEAFDLVLLDAPCSGFGVIRRKPEIKWTKTPEDVQAIAGLRQKLLEEASLLVRPGGRLVYSTCTVERSENEDQILRFLDGHPEFVLDAEWPEGVLAPLRKAGVIGDEFVGMAQLLPQHFHSDGFFIARLRKRP